MDPIDRETRRYMTMVRALPILDKEQELALALRYRQHGDRRAADRLITANLRNVVPMALRFMRYGLPLSDLIAEGNAALMTVLERFEPERGLRFATYANHWVRAEMLGYVLRSRSLVDGGRGQLRSKYFFKLRREHARLLGELGDAAAVHLALAERFALSVDEVRAILERLERPDGSLDTRVGEGREQAVVETLSANLPDQEHTLCRSREHELLRAAVAAATADLSERDRYIVERRLLADSDEAHSLVQIGEHFGVSRERARQLESRVKSTLRKRLSGVQRNLAGADPAAA